jgi:ankyrin repeat protein
MFAKSSFGIRPTSKRTRDNQGWTPLMFCAQEGRLDCLELLLKNGADVNASDYAGRNSLMQAAERCGFPEIAIRLLKAQACMRRGLGKFTDRGGDGRKDERW